MQQNNGMSRAAAMAYRVLIRRGVSALPVHPLEILSACRNTVVWADVTAAEQLKIPREVLLLQLANAEAITFRQTIQGETHFIVVYREGGNPARLRFTLAHELGHRLLHRGARGGLLREPPALPAPDVGAALRAGKHLFGGAGGGACVCVRLSDAAPFARGRTGGFAGDFVRGG